jgi:NADH:ubiquinone reductase (H+-translocating)
VLSRLAGERPENLNQSFGAQCISLGRRTGIFQFGNRSDVAVWLHIDGRLGSKVKEAVCKGIVKHLADEAHKPGGYSLHRMKGGAGRMEALEAMRVDRGEAPAVVERVS